LVRKKKGGKIRTKAVAKRRNNSALKLGRRGANAIG